MLGLGLRRVPASSRGAPCRGWVRLPAEERSHLNTDRALPCAGLFGPFRAFLIAKAECAVSGSKCAPKGRTHDHGATPRPGFDVPSSSPEIGFVPGARQLVRRFRSQAASRIGPGTARSGRTRSPAHPTRQAVHMLQNVTLSRGFQSSAFLSPLAPSRLH
jgi:hypothetical protein